MSHFNRPALTPDQMRKGLAVMSLLSKLKQKTGISSQTLSIILVITIVVLGITTLVSFYFAYRAHKKCTDKPVKLLPFTGLFVASVVLYVMAHLTQKMIFTPAALACNILLIVLSYKYCSSTAAEYSD